MNVRSVNVCFIEIFYKNLIVNPSVHGTIVRLEEKSALEDVCFIEIPLYQNFAEERMRLFYEPLVRLQYVTDEI